MIIKISNLSNGEHTFVFENKVDVLGLELPFYGKYKSSIVLVKLNDQLILTASTDFKMKYDCDRCGCEYKSALTSDYKMVYLMNEEPEETDSINISYLSKEADKIDLTNDVREFATLSVPMKKLCKDECKGLCPKCGTDLNKEQCNCKDDETDPRWKPLIDLKDKLNLN